MTADAGAPPAPPRPREQGFDRRSLIVAAVLLIGAIVGGVVAVALLSGDGSSTTTETTLSSGGDVAVAPPPAIVPKPNTGTAPDDPGDRGGWEQLALLAIIVSAMVGIGVVIARGGGRRARANRQAWRDAATAGAASTAGPPDHPEDRGTA